MDTVYTVENVPAMSVEQYAKVLQDVHDAKVLHRSIWDWPIGYRAFVQLCLHILYVQLRSKFQPLMDMELIVDDNARTLANVKGQRDAFEDSLNRHREGMREMFGLEDIVHDAVQSATEDLDIDEKVGDWMQYNFCLSDWCDIADYLPEMPCADGIRSARQDIVDAFEAIGSALENVAEVANSVDLESF